MCCPKKVHGDDIHRVAEAAGLGPVDAFRIQGRIDHSHVSR